MHSWHPLCCWLLESQQLHSFWVLLFTKDWNFLSENMRFLNFDFSYTNKIAQRVLGTQSFKRVSLIPTFAFYKFWKHTERNEQYRFKSHQKLVLKLFFNHYKKGCTHLLKKTFQLPLWKHFPILYVHLSAH